MLTLIQNRKQLLVSILIGFLFIFTSKTASADEMGRTKTHQALRRGQSPNSPWVGIRAGVADLDGNQYGTSGEYGAEVGFEPTSNLGIAMEYAFYNTDPGGVTPEYRRSKLLLRTQLNFGGSMAFVRDSYVGAGLGPVWDTVNGSTATEFGIAPIIGFDIPVPNRKSAITIGANANYLFVGNTDVPDVFAVNGALKYWF